MLKQIIIIVQCHKPKKKKQIIVFEAAGMCRRGSSNLAAILDPPNLNLLYMSTITFLIIILRKVKFSNKLLQRKSTPQIGTELSLLV